MVFSVLVCWWYVGNMSTSASEDVTGNISVKGYESSDLSSNDMKRDSFCETRWEGNRSTFCCFKG